MALSGVRSSWLIDARKRDLARFASSARRLASSDIVFAVSELGNQRVLLRAERQQQQRGAVDAVQRRRRRGAAT